MHKLPHPTSEQFACGADAIGRRAFGDGSIADTTCPWCLRVLDVDPETRFTPAELSALQSAGFEILPEVGEDEWMISHPSLYERFVDSEGKPCSDLPAQYRYTITDGKFYVEEPTDHVSFHVALPLPGEEAAFLVDLASLFVQLYMLDFNALANYYEN